VRREKVGKVTDFAALFVTEAIEGTLARAADSETAELIGEPGTLDPPGGLEQLDERYPRRIRGPEQICRSRPCPGWTGGIKEGSDVPGITTHSGAQSPHREAGAFEDVPDRPSELLIIWWHVAILPQLDRA
jgi:hypothetical protein